MVAAVGFERHVTGAGIFGVIVHKLSHWWKTGPVILFKVDKVLELGLQDTIVPLCFIISVQVKCGTKPTLNAKKVAKG